jgi:hypothetical protein
VPTVGISLVRPHTEVIKPPRALWVPFEMGHPMGAPDAAFQRRVLLAALRLLEAPHGPVLEDYPEDAPETDEAIVLACPVNYARDVVEPGETDPLGASFRREITAMRPWYDMAVNQRQRTTVGLSGIDLEKLGDFIYTFVSGHEPANPRDDMPLASTLKMAIEDLKAYYIEGATAQPCQENLSSKAIMNWFWDETVAGKVLLELGNVLKESQDEEMKHFGEHSIAPLDILSRQKGWKPPWESPAS